MSRAIIADVSFYDDDPGIQGYIDYNKMKAAGISGVIVRAGQNKWVDSSFKRSWVDSKLAGIPRGSYWYFDDRVSPQDQARLWIRTLGDDLGELPLCADLEASYGGVFADTTGYNFKLFLDELKRLAPSKDIMIYTGYWYWKERVSADLHWYFSQFRLWIAAYNNIGPTVPEPWHNWTMWQFTDTGNGFMYGTDGSIDLSYFNGTDVDFRAEFNLGGTVPIENVKDTATNTHMGVMLHTIERFGTTCFVHVIDTSLARVEVSDCGFKTPSFAANKYGAQVVSNGGGWPNVQDAKHRSNEMWYSNGKCMQTPSYIKDNRPYINISESGNVSVSNNSRVMPGIFNALGYDRILLWNGVFNSAISELTVKDARTGSGVTADGKLVLLSAEGNDVRNIGLTFPEMASILKEFGVVNGGNNDGGSSSAIINTAVSNTVLFEGSDGHEAPVINHFIVYANVLDIPIETTDDPVVVETGIRKYVVVRDIKPRPNPSISGGSRQDIKAGYVFESSNIQPGLPPPTEFVRLTDGDWLPLVYKGVEYVKKAGLATPTPTAPTGRLAVVLSSYDKTGLSRATVNNSPAKARGIPDPVQYEGTNNDENKPVILTERLQWFWYNACVAKTPWLSDAQHKASFNSLTTNDRYITNGHGSNSLRVYPTGKNSTKKDMQYFTLLTSHAIIEIAGEHKFWAKSWKTPFYVIDASKSVEEFTPEAYPYRWYRPLNSCRERLYDSRKRFIGYDEHVEEPFPQFNEQAIVPMFMPNTNIAWIEDDAIRVLEENEALPYPFTR